MAVTTSGPSPQTARYAMADWQRPAPNVAKQAAGGLSRGWALFGLGVIALGVVGYVYLGPDLRRYLHAKARTLGVERLAWYDIFAPVGVGTRAWSYADATAYIVSRQPAPNR